MSTTAPFPRRRWRPARVRSAPLLFTLARAVLVGELFEHRIVGLEIGLPVAVRSPIDPPRYPFLGFRPHHGEGDREREAGEFPDTPCDLAGEALVEGGVHSPGASKLATERRANETRHRDDRYPEE